MVLTVSVGYAVLSTNLTINGTGKIANAKWDVHFENVRSTNNSTVTPTTAPSAPAANKVTSLSYVVNLDVPGDVYEFLVDVVNAGAIDAKLDSLTSRIRVGNSEEVNVSAATLPSYLEYSVTMGDGSSIIANHNLAARASETYKVHVEFKRDITNEEFAEAQEKTITFTFTLNYAQADGANAPEGMCPGCRYFRPTEEIWLTWNAQNVSPIVLGDNDLVDDYHDLHQNTFLGVTLDDTNQINRIYACGIYNSALVCLQSAQHGAYYESNKLILNSLFDVCTEHFYNGDNRSEFICNEGTTTMTINNYSETIVEIGNNNCETSDSGSAGCN